MAYDLLQQLLYEITENDDIKKFAGKNVSHLTSRAEFKKIETQDSSFAKKLKLAWEGDGIDYTKSKGKGFDPLFPKMLEPNAIKKFAPTVKLTPTEIGVLKQLALMSFPTIKSKTDNSVWKNERWAYEELADFDQNEYNILREEIEAL